MIWLYITAAIVAQAIVVVLLVEFINRRSKPDEVVAPQLGQQEEDTQPSAKDARNDEAIGESKFNYEAFKAMQDEIKSLKECVETLMDAKDAEFDEPAQKEKEEEQETKDDAPGARMSPEEEMKAWEDNRDDIARLEREDDTVAYPNQLATGADFDSITKATVILETADGRTPEDLRFAMNIYRTLEGTQFSGCLPDALLDKLIECHRKVEIKINSAPEDKIQEEPTAPAVEEKPIPQPKKEEELKEKFEEPAKEPVPENTPRFSMDFVRKHKQNK